MNQAIVKKVYIGPHVCGAVRKEKTNPTLIGVRHAETRHWYKPSK